MRARRVRWLALAVNVAGFLFAPSLAHAGPVVTVVATVAAYLGATVGTAIAIGEFVAFVVLPNIALSVFSKLTAPKAPSAPERQASVISMQLGESAREAIFGEAATAGQLLDAFNYGGEYGTDWETLVIAVADHRCEALVGYYITDVFYPFTADGVQPGFNGQLSVNWHDGQIGQPADADLIANSDGRWTANDRAAGVAYVVVSYKADAPNANFPVWPQGRPAFLWRVKGARLYDPRKDSTVAGASGAHRWSNPATWEWSDNAYLCRYAYSRGIYAGDQVGDPTQLLIGRGLSATQAPPERVAAYANLCDELVTLKVGGSEKRYRVNGVVRATDAFIDIENVFATSMAGVIVQRDGGVEIEPGAAKAAVVTFTDADLPVGLPIRVEQFLSDADRVNTVTARYVEPEQAWRDHAAPVRRSTADIVADGGTREKTLNLALVTSHTQAQRCGEIDRRLGRLERRVALSLGPRFAYVEDGDWVAWQSDRYFAGATVTFRVEAASLDQAYRSQLLLREIAPGAFSWDAATDEGTPGAAPVDEAGALPAVALSGVAFQAVSLTGADGSKQPAVKAVWATPVDPAISGVRLEVRIVGAPSYAATIASEPNVGEIVTTNGVAGSASLEARVVPIAVPGRRVSAWAWTPVTADPLVTPEAADTTPPAAPSGLAAGGLSGGVQLTWANPADADLVTVQIWENTSNVQPNPATQPSLMVGSAAAQAGKPGVFVRSNLAAGATRWYWVRAVDRTGNVSGFNATSGVVATATGAVVDTTPPAAPTALAGSGAFANIVLTWVNPTDVDLATVEIWENTTTTQPDPVGHPELMVGAVAASPGRNGVFVRPGLAPGVTRYYWVRALDQSHNASGFNATAGVAVTTASLQIDDFASSIKPVGRGSALPTASTYLGDVFFNTTDAKLYRKNAAGTAWQTIVPTSDLSGQITGTQIADGSISTPKLTANAVTANEIAANAVTASELAADAVTASKILAGSISASHIASRSISADRIAAGALTATEIAAGTITGDRIAGATIAAGKLVANTLTTGQIQADNLAITLKTVFTPNFAVSGASPQAICSANGSSRANPLDIEIEVNLSNSGGSRGVAYHAILYWAGGAALATLDNFGGYTQGGVAGGYNAVFWSTRFYGATAGSVTVQLFAWIPDGATGFSMVVDHVVITITDVGYQTA